MNTGGVYAYPETQRAIPETSRLTTLAIAWIGTLLMSRLPEIIARDGFGLDVPWMNWLWIGVACVMLAVTSTLAPRSLQGYFLIMLVILLVTTVLDPLIRGTGVWTSTFGNDQSAVVVLLAERVLIAFEAMLVVVALALMGLKRTEYFMTMGDLNAPVGGLKRPVRWEVVGPVLALVLTVFYVGIATTFVSPTADRFAQALPLIPLALLAAVLNAFSEEAMYRAAPLSRLLGPIGSGQALLLTSLWFGLGHYYGGTPSGLMGLVFATLLALLFGKAMLDTRGIAWPWVLHFLADAVIFIFLAMATVAA